MQQSFEDFIITCCAMEEWELRDYLKGLLIPAGFKIQEDDYRSSRGGEFAKIHNMLAIRGETPKICLVAHTDVCRDHGWRREHHPKVNPVIKTIPTPKGERKVIQDKDTAVQTGGDDRLGVAINTWIALNTGYDMGLLFTTDEEIGALSADRANFSELLDFDVLVQVDRGNHSDQLVVNISGTSLCDDETATRLLGIAEKIGLPRVPVMGLLTDVLEIKRNRRCKNAVNMTCGYHRSFGSSPEEFIDIEEARETMEYVSNIIQDYDLEDLKDVNSESEVETETTEEVEILDQ